MISPLITRIDPEDTKKLQVQLVIQSVREFTIREWQRLEGTTGSSAVHKADTRRSVSLLHHFLLNICIRHLMLRGIDSIPFFSEEHMLFVELCQAPDVYDESSSSSEYVPHSTWETLEKDMPKYDPVERGFGELFAYTSSYWSTHLGAVEQEPLPSIARMGHSVARNQ